MMHEGGGIPATCVRGRVRRLPPRPLATVDHLSTNEQSRVTRTDGAVPSSEPTFLTDAQLAERWQMSRGTLANQRSQGRGPAYVKLAGTVRYRESDIEAYEAAGRVDVGGPSNS